MMNLNNIANFSEEYFKHTALNLGQAFQGIRYIYSHPKMDKQFVRGSIKHLLHSFMYRSKIILNDLYFATIPPHWHHTPAEIKSLHQVSAIKWFLYGYCAWRFDELGGYKKLTGEEDKRWDPRCSD